MATNSALCTADTSVATASHHPSPSRSRGAASTAARELALPSLIVICIAAVAQRTAAQGWAKDPGLSLFSKMLVGQLAPMPAGAAIADIWACTSSHIGASRMTVYTACVCCRSASRSGRCARSALPKTMKSL